MFPKLVHVVILFTLISGCALQVDWVEMGLGTWTSRRFMGRAAAYAGLELIRELRFLKKRERPLYRVTFDGRRQFSMAMHTCTAFMFETVAFRPKVIYYSCNSPVY